jgi:hypothetical protein
MPLLTGWQTTRWGTPHFLTCARGPSVVVSDCEGDEVSEGFI